MGWQSDPIIEAKPAWESDLIVAPGAGAGARALHVHAGAPLPALFTKREGAQAAGYYPLGRIFSVGDRATVRHADALTGVVAREATQQVTAVDIDNDRVEINHGGQVWDLMGNVLEKGTDRRNVSYNVPRQFAPAELYVGRKWTAVFTGDRSDGERRATIAFRITRRETVRVPAGEFYAFRIEGNGWRDNPSGDGQSGTMDVHTIWLVPGLNFAVCSEHVRRKRNGSIRKAERQELVSARQRVVGIALD